MLRKHDFDAPDALVPVTSGAASVTGEPPPPPEPVYAEEDSIDLRDLEDAPPADAPLDSQARLIESFGAQVVEERPRT
jgi:hypothetical protein